MSYSTETTEALLADNERLRQRVAELEQQVAAQRAEPNLFKDLADSAPEAIGLGTLDTLLFYLNPAYYEMSGFGDELIGQPVFAMYDEDPDDIRLIVQYMREHGYWRGVLRYRRKDGSTFQGQTSLTMLRDHQGAPAAIAGIVRDMTERLRTEGELRESEERFRQLAENIQQVFALQDAYSGELIYISPAYETIWGRSRASLRDAPLSFLEATHPDDYERIACSYDRFTREGHLDEVCRIVRPDGEIRWVRVRGFPIYDEAGVLYRLAGIAEDITAHKQMEREIALSQQRLNAFFTSAPAGLVLLDNQFRYVQINETAARLNGLSIEAHIGRPVEEVMPALAPKLLPLYEEIMATGKPLLNIEMSGKMLGLPHVPTHLQASLFPIPGSDGKPAGIGAILVDTTEQHRAEEALRQAQHDLEHRVDKRTAELSRANTMLLEEIAQRMEIEAELERHRTVLEGQVAQRTAALERANQELERASRLKDEFLANMSHELRTPLNSILGLAESMREGTYGPLSDPQDASLISIDESGRHLLDMINDILDVAKIGAGKITLNIDIASVKAICQASLRLVRQSAYKKHITVSEDLDDAVMLIQVDQRRLKQILVNLLSNAVKFTPMGGTIGLTVRGDLERRFVHFTVWDTGIGIAREDQERLFLPFEQVDSSLSRLHGGTGLGLALVARLTEMHGGLVSVESEAGQGSRFCISLPWNEDETEQLPPLPAASSLPASSAHPAPAAWSASEPPLILLAEDNEDTIAMLSEYLQMRGFACIIARTGIEAVEQAFAQRPALILMDIQMPGIDGLEATRRLRAAPELADTPIVALTALAMPGDRERCLEAGASDYMSKPISLRYLEQTIATFL
jgi:PAS domain S-box-containing protein